MWDDDGGTLDNQPQNDRSNAGSKKALNDTVMGAGRPPGPLRAQRPPGRAHGVLRRHVTQLVLVVDAIVVELAARLRLRLRPCPSRVGLGVTDLFAIQSRRNVFHLARGHVSSQKAFRSVVSWRSAGKNSLFSAPGGTPLCIL